MTLAFTARTAATWTDGQLRAGSGDVQLAGVSIDSRSLEPGQLFVAIRGERHDGHRFLDAALAGAAAGVLVEAGAALPARRDATWAVIEVEDTTRALGALAAGHRAGFDGPLVAITGSNGKTTTKEMCAAILGVASPCLKNRGNLNNQFGLPLTLLERDAHHRSVVVEIGMNHPGEIAPLARIARPDVAVITNVGSAHLEHMGSLEAIAREKGELIAALGPDAVAVLNADDARVLAQASRTRARVATFGRGADADFRAERVERLASGFGFELVTPGGSTAVRVTGLAEVSVTNALAAAAAALAAGAPLGDVAPGLARHRAAPGRLERRDLPGEVILVDDTYNANPHSLEVALRCLAALPGPGRRVAVLGEMAELGPEAGAAHREAGRLAAGLGIDLLVAVGQLAGQLAAGAAEAGMQADCVHVSACAEEAATQVGKLVRARDRVLVKGSRSAHMERVVQALSAASEPR